MAFMTFMGIATMVGGLAGAAWGGGTAVKGDADLRQTISATNAQTNHIQSQFSNILKGTDELDEDMKTNITQTVDAIEENRAKLVLLKKGFASQMKKLQFIGLIVLSIIFFLLVFKWSGLEGLLIKAIKDVIHKHKNKKRAKKAAKIASSSKGSAAKKAAKIASSSKGSAAPHLSPQASEGTPAVVENTLQAHPTRNVGSATKT